MPQERYYRAITTKYFGPGNVRGSRIKASDGDGHSVTISLPDELRIEEAHRLAAEKLAEKMNWPGRLVGGKTKDIMVWVFID